MSKPEPTPEEIAARLLEAFDLDGVEIDASLDDSDVEIVAEYVGELIPLDQYRKGAA